MKELKFFLIPILAFILTFSAQTQNVDTSGLAELKKGDYESAIKLFNTRLATNSADASAQASHRDALQNL